MPLLISQLISSCTAKLHPHGGGGYFSLCHVIEAYLLASYDSPLLGLQCFPHAVKVLLQFCVSCTRGTCTEQQASMAAYM